MEIETIMINGILNDDIQSILTHLGLTWICARTKEGSPQLPGL